MPFGADLLGAAWTYATSAYTYNLGRFQFDAGQQQTSAHLRMNLRLAQWNLFREDVRDLFALTTQNMSTYMVVGTLFLGFAVSFVYGTLKDFPLEPSWLILFLGNCVFSALVFGILAVWLAMHGSIAAHSASVKVLTQAVRPPIPTIEDTEAARFSRTKYENAGPGAFLQPPDLLGLTRRGLPNASHSSSSGSALPSVQTGVGEKAWVGSPFLTDAEGVGAGRTAAFDAHVDLFKHLQLQYSCFDAYARVALSATANQVLLICAYFTIGHLMVKYDNEQPVRCKALTWCSVALCIVTSRVLFKLDLYIEKWQMRMLIDLFVAGPFVVCLAAHFWVDSRIHATGAIIVSDVTIELLALIASFLHAACTALLIWQARPQEGNTQFAKMPTSFRSVQYLDVFGWFDEKNVLSKMDSTVSVPESIDAGSRARADQITAEVVQRASSLQHTIASLLTPGVVDHLAEHDVQMLDDKRTELNEILSYLTNDVHGFPSHLTESLDDRHSFVSQSLSLPCNDRLCDQNDMWLQCTFTNDCGHDAQYFVNSRSAEVIWDPPPGGTVLNLNKLRSSVDALRQEVSGSTESKIEATTPRHHVRVRFDSSSNTAEHEPGNVQPTSGDASLFATPVRRPGSSHDTGSMPWKYFAQVGVAVVLVWVATFLWIGIVDIFHCRYLDPQEPHQSPPKLASAKFVPVSWPHAFFRPSALACGGELMVLGDRFALYSAGLAPSPTGKRHQSHDEKSPNRSFMHRVGGLSTFARWRSLALACNEAKSICDVLLLLALDEQAVFEHPISSTKSARRWPLNKRIRANVLAISAMSPDRASMLCTDVQKNISWGLYGFTSQGQVVSLCPVDGVLEAMHSLYSVPSLAKRSQDHFLGLHVHDSGAWWLLTHDRFEDRYTLASWGSDGTRHGISELPTGRVWAPGLCFVGEESVILASNRNASDSLAHPELWHLNFTLNQTTDSDTLRSKRLFDPVSFNTEVLLF